MRKTLEELAVEVQIGELCTRGEDWGGTFVRVLRLPPGADFRPLFRGLPGDVCSCPHWGYVLEGSIHIGYADGTEEISRAGDIYHWPGGHVGWSEEGVTFIEISPAAELRPVLDHVGPQLAPA
jgi:hypothetical protein